MAPGVTPALTPRVTRRGGRVDGTALSVCSPRFPHSTLFPRVSGKGRRETDKEGENGTDRASAGPRGRKARLTACFRIGQHFSLFC